MRRDRQGAVALILVVVVAAAVLAAVLMVGVRRVPDYPSVAERRDPAVQGTIAYLQRADDGSASCVFVVAASGGAARQVYCASAREEPAGLLWQGDGTLVVSAYGEIDTAVRIDLRAGRAERITFDVQSAFTYPRDVSEPRESDGARLASDDWGGDATTAWLDLEIGGDTRRLVSASGPRGYSFYAPRWSPDGRWVLFEDTEERLLIVREDDPAEVRVVARRASSAVVTDLQIEPVPVARP